MRIILWSNPWRKIRRSEYDVRKMDLNVRRKKILYDLLSGDYRPSLEQLADEYQISPRSVRYDLQVINQILQER